MGDLAAWGYAVQTKVSANTYQTSEYLCFKNEIFHQGKYFLTSPEKTCLGHQRECQNFRPLPSKNVRTALTSAGWFLRLFPGFTWPEAERDPTNGIHPALARIHNSARQPPPPAFAFRPSLNLGNRPVEYDRRNGLHIGRTAT